MKLFIALVYCFSLFADYDPCRYIKVSSCGNRSSINKTIGTSNPTASSSFSAPSALAAIRGIGVEAIIFEGSDISFVTGNGRVGAGVSSSNSDDIFFGNTAKESVNDYQNRISNTATKYNTNYVK